MSANSFDARAELAVGDRRFEIFRLDALQARFDVARLPFSLKILLENLLRTEGNGSVTAPDVEAALANVRHVTESLAATSDHLDRFVADNEPGLSRFANQSLPQFEQLLRESRAAARDFRDLSRSLKQNPSQLLYETNSRGVQVPR